LVFPNPDKENNMIGKLLSALLAGVLLAACVSLPHLVSPRESLKDPLQVTIYKAPL
jgi:hypothetical protein